MGRGMQVLRLAAADRGLREALIDNAAVVWRERHAKAVLTSWRRGHLDWQHHRRATYLQAWRQEAATLTLTLTLTLILTASVTLQPHHPVNRRHAITPT